MSHVILNIKDKSKLSFLMEILKRMEFVEVVQTDKYTTKEKKILADLEKAVDQVKLHKAGKVQLKTLQQVIDEL